MKLLEENIQRILQEIRMNKVFLDKTPKAQEIKKQTNGILSN